MISDKQIHDFFTAYGDTLARYDAEATAAMWGMPGMMLADGFVGVLDSREEMATGLSQGYPLYRRTGLAAVRCTVLEHVALTDRISRAHVRWGFLDGDGVELTDSSYEYTVHADESDHEDGLRVYVAVAIDSQEKLTELLDRLGIDPEHTDGAIPED